MREAIALAQRKVLAGHGGPFGAIIVRASEIVGRGWNQVTSANDPTAHSDSRRLFSDLKLFFRKRDYLLQL